MPSEDVVKWKLEIEIALQGGYEADSDDADLGRKDLGIL